MISKMYLAKYFFGLCVILQLWASTLLADPNDVKLLIDGYESLAETVKMIREAKTSIHLMSFSLVPDEVGTILVKELAAAAKRGVSVNIVQDSKPIMRHGGKHLFVYLAAAGCNIKFLSGNPSAPVIFKSMSLVHDKALVIDRKIVKLGGRNSSEHYYVGADEFVDFDIKIEGPAGESAAKYVEMRLEQGTEVLLAAFRKSAPPIEQIIAEMDALPGFKESPFVAGLKAKSQPFGEVHAAVNVEFVTNVGSNAKYIDNTEAIASVVRDAPKGGEVSMMSPFVVPTNRLLKAFDVAKENDVHVELMTNHEHAENVFPLKADVFNMLSKRQLANRNVETYEYRGKYRAHSKYVTNGQTTYIGSSIFNPLSEYLNSELGVVIDSPKLADEIKAVTKKVKANSGLIRPPSLKDFGMCNVMYWWVAKKTFLRD